MGSKGFFRKDRRAVVVAIDHTLYTWPCIGLEDRQHLIQQVARGGADAIIASYGTIRNFRSCFGTAKPILKLDLTELSLGEAYAATDHVVCWTVEDALRLDVNTVMTYVQLGTSFELEGLRAAGRLAAACDDAGLTYVCEIMPIESERYPDPAAPDAIVASCRTGAELGAHIIKTTMPTPAETIKDAVSACGVPVILAGGELTGARTQLLSNVGIAMQHGASGVAFGRNVWGAPDIDAMMKQLVGIIHPHSQGD